MLSSLQAKQNSNLQNKIMTIHRVSELKVRINETLDSFVTSHKEKPLQWQCINFLTGYV